MRNRLRLLGQLGMITAMIERRHQMANRHCEELGRRVRALRDRKGMTQAKLAGLTGLTQASISLVENGQQTDVESRTLARLAEALGATTDFLVGREDSLSAVDLLLIDPTALRILRIVRGMSRQGRERAATVLTELAAARA